MKYQIIRSRRKTVAIEITPRGEILVRCPQRLSRRDIHRFVESRQPWIARHLQAMAALPPVSVLTAEEHASLIRSARAFFPERTAHFADRLGVTYGHITIRSQRTRWGSCSAQGNLSFNCLLMLAPEDVREYVIVHELCHRKQMNQSPQFWAEVEAVLPDYRNRKQWLKQQGSSLLASIPDAQK